MYTWGCSKLEENYNYTRNGSSCSGLRIQSFRKGSMHKQRQQSRKDSVNFNRKATSQSISKKVILYVFVCTISEHLLEFFLFSFIFLSFLLLHVVGIFYCADCCFGYFTYWGSQVFYTRNCFKPWRKVFRFWKSTCELLFFCFLASYHRTYLVSIFKYSTLHTLLPLFCLAWV